MERPLDLQNNVDRLVHRYAVNSVVLKEDR